MSTTDHTVRFEKYHGTGNDFVVVDANDPVPDRPAFASIHCNRATGVGTSVDPDTEARTDADPDTEARTGADGVLFLALESEYRPPRVIMTLVQPDGSVAPMCGNGARVAAAWAAERTDSAAIMVDTPAGTRRADIHGDEVTIEMGIPSFAPRDVPLARDEPLIAVPAVDFLDDGVDTAPFEGLTMTAVNTGVPHAVAFVDDVDDVDFEAVAPPIRHASVFPQGTNVTIASRDGDGFRQRTFERGVERETRSCGTGAVAVVAVARRLGHLDDDAPVRVSPPGGDLVIEVPEAALNAEDPFATNATSTLRGPVVHEFDGEIAAAPTAD